jgi:5-(carboxyamino)imidazole ribonucleotide synthase
MSEMQIYPPGSAIGILGGGQLGRMTALAAAKLGYQPHIYCQSADEPAAHVTNRVTLGAFDDPAALKAFAAQVAVVTLEWENVPLAALTAVAEVAPMYPAATVLAIAQDRLQEKQFARSLGLGTAEFTAIHSAADLAQALQSGQHPAILKTCRLGYDGKGQLRLTAASDPVAVWQQLGGTPAILERLVDFTAEISVIVARRADGVAAAFPPVRNVHQDGVLATTHAPAMLPPALAAEAVAAATRLAEALDVVGLLAVEMFVLAAPNAAGHSILINEIAPRPHNSGHWTLDACATSQFEQLIRAVCGLPLGSVALHGSAVMHNLLGAAAADWAHWLAQPNAQLHLYGKATATPGRKMGHVTLVKPPE